jgi:hypothetical protein
MLQTLLPAYDEIRTALLQEVDAIKAVRGLSDEGLRVLADIHRNAIPRMRQGGVVDYVTLQKLSVAVDLIKQQIEKSGGTLTIATEPLAA